MVIPHVQLSTLLYFIQSHNVTISDIIITLLCDSYAQQHDLAVNLMAHSKDILSALHFNKSTLWPTAQWAHDLMKVRYINTIQLLSQKENGWHYSAFNATAEKLQNFCLKEMADKMKNLAPEFWDLLTCLLSAGFIGDAEIQGQSEASNVTPAQEPNDSNEADYWLNHNDIWNDGTEKIEHAEDNMGHTTNNSKQQWRKCYIASVRIINIPMIQITSCSTDHNLCRRLL